jgi:hypothetical protein
VIFRNWQARNFVTILAMTVGRWIVFLLIAACACATAWFAGAEQRHLSIPKDTARVKTVLFEEVTNAKDGDRVTLTDWIDIKYVCMDVTPSQREICTTALVRSDHRRTESLEIRLRVCSDTRTTDCIVFDSDPRRVDFRNVFLRDHDGNAIDFDGETLIEPPNTWTAYPKRVKVTGRVKVVDGTGQLIEPIERIDPE